MNDMKNKKAEIIEIILVTILVSLSINLISSSIFTLDDIKSIIIMVTGVVICISIVIYYLKIKVRSMHIDKFIEGNIILNSKHKNIYQLLEYYSSFLISEDVYALMLENKEFSKKYKDSLKNIDKFNEDNQQLQNSYFSFAINSAIEYQILNLLTDHLHLDDEDVKTIDINNASKDILNNIFIKTLAKDYKTRKVFNDCEDRERDGEELVSIRSDEGYIYDKFAIAIPKNAVLTKKRNSIVIKSKYFKINIEWGIDNASFPFPDMEFYNFFNVDKIDYDDIEIAYYIKAKVEYSLLSMFSKKSDKYYLWIEFVIGQLIEIFDFKDCLKRNNWDLLKNIDKILKEKYRF